MMMHFIKSVTKFFFILKRQLFIADNLLIKYDFNPLNLKQVVDDNMFSFGLNKPFSGSLTLPLNRNFLEQTKCNIVISTSGIFEKFLF